MYRRYVPITNEFNWRVTVESRTDGELDSRKSPVFNMRFNEYPVRRWQMRLEEKPRQPQFSYSDTEYSLSVKSLNQGFVTSKFSVVLKSVCNTCPDRTWNTCVQTFQYGTTCTIENSYKTLKENIVFNFVCTYKELSDDDDETQLSGDLNSLMIDPLYSDFVIKNGEKSWDVHKAILSARSPVFRTMLESSFKESKQNCSEIKDMDPDVIDEMIRYIYTGKKPDLESISAEELLMAADKYQLPHLKEICGKEITSELTVENACHNLVIADLCSCSILKAEVLAFIKRNSKSVVQSDGYKELSRDKNKFELLSDIVLALAKI